MPIWSAISRFGNPYPPFDYNSGMGVDDVSYDEALKLGVLPSKHYQPPEESPIKSFNDKVEASMSMSGPDDAKFTNLQKVFGDQIQYNKHTKRAVFDGAMIHDVAKKVGDDFRAGKNTTDVKAKPTIGRPSSLFAEAAPSASKDAELRIPASNLMHIFQDHVGKDKDSRNVALTERELGLIGHIWRQPENVLDGKGGQETLNEKGCVWEYLCTCCLGWSKWRCEFSHLLQSQKGCENKHMRIPAPDRSCCTSQPTF